MTTRIPFAGSASPSLLAFAVVLGLAACSEFPEFPDISDADTTAPDVEPDVQPDTETTSPDLSDTTQPDTPRPLAPPTHVVASTDRSNDIELTWDAAPNATAYRIERCDAVCADADWDVLADVPATPTRYLDTSPTPAAPPAAPTLTASDHTDRVRLTWSAVTAPEAPRYRYRVVSLGPEADSEPSEPTTGQRAERPVTGYEVQILAGSASPPGEIDDAWRPIGGAGDLATHWDDTDAPAPTITAGTIAASQGTYAEFVRVIATGTAGNDGAPRTYRIRATTEYGPGPASEEVSGRRLAGPTRYRWERSEGASDDDFSVLVGATTTTYDDTSAPADGSARFYRIIVSAEGAVSATSVAVPGSRQPPPGIVGSVAASSDLLAQVRVTWQPLSGALSYHVYRDGQKLTSGTGIVATSYDDTAAGAPPGTWQAPTDVSASQDQSDHITLTWSAPGRPAGPLHTYEVSAVNHVGESALSAPTQGRRAAPALARYEIETTIGTATVYRDVGLVTVFHDVAAPFATVDGGAITASKGDHRAHVTLAAQGGEVHAPAPASYRVRGVLSDGTQTPLSSQVTGRRAVGPLTRTWQRSSGPTPGGWTDLECTTADCDDLDAPSTGERRWYRQVAGAAGAQTTYAPPVEGWRLTFVSLALGDQFSCGLTPLVPDGGRIWCWGRNGSGQLGLGHTSASEPPTRVPNLSGAVQIVTGNDHVCARKDAGGVWCWGRNGNGQLGDASTTDRTSPVQVPGLSASHLTAKGYAVCALVSAQVRCWGSGMLGNNSNTQRSSPVTAVVPEGDPLDQVRDVTRGPNHTCAIKTDGTVWCWGNNAYGELGLSTPEQSVAAIRVNAVTGFDAFALGTSFTCGRAGSQVRCWGANGFGQLGIGHTTSTHVPTVVTGLTQVAQLGAGYRFGCARTSGGALSCWGQGGSGQLGHGVFASSNTPVAVADLTATTLAVGQDHACAIHGGDVYCWGRNLVRELGDGTATNRSVPVLVLFP